MNTIKETATTKKPKAKPRATIRCNHNCNINPQSLPMEMLTQSFDFIKKDGVKKDTLIVISIFVLFFSNIIWSFFLFNSHRNYDISATDSRNTIISDGDVHIAANE